MPAGRPAKPVATLKLQGSYRPDRHDGRYSEEGTPPRRPKLGRHAAWPWKQMEPTFVQRGIVEADLPALRTACEFYEEYRERISSDDRRDVRLAIACWREVDHLLSRFGFTPVDRTKLRGSETAAAEEDEFDRYLRAAR